MRAEGRKADEEVATNVLFCSESLHDVWCIETTCIEIPCITSDQ